MGKSTWVGTKRWDLLTLSWPDFHAKYPDILKNTYKGKRNYYKKQLNEGKIAMETDGKIAKSWEAAAYNRETNEWETTMLHSYDHALAPAELAIQYPPAESARITPTRRRVAKRIPNMLLVYGDGQVDFRRIIDPVTDEMELVPLHDIPAHRVVQQLNARWQPEETINLGDFADMTSLSRFSPDSDHFHKTLGPSMRWIHNFYAQMVADNPKGKHTEVDSNHAVRVKKRVLDNLDALYDFVIPGEDYPVLSYYRLANLGALGIHFVSGYGAAESVYGNENQIVFKHGNHSSSVLGATVRKEASENPTVNVVRGHGHGDEEVRQTTREGRQLFYKMIGTTCINNGPVPGYRSAVDDHNRPVSYHNKKHQNTVAMIEDYGEGVYQLTTIDIINGKAVFRGEQYNGNEQ